MLWYFTSFNLRKMTGQSLDRFGPLPLQAHFGKGLGKSFLGCVCEGLEAGELSQEVLIYPSSRNGCSAL